MIFADEIIPKLLQACPSAQSEWEEHLAFWEDEPRGYYNDTAVFARHIVHTHPLNELKAFFDVLELLLQEGDKEVKDIITIGVIEDIQNMASHQEQGYVVFEKWLSPLSLKAWREVEAMWEGKTSLAQVVISESENKNLSSE